MKHYMVEKATERMAHDLGECGKFKRETLRCLRNGYRQRERAALKRELLAQVADWAIESSMK